MLGYIYEFISLLFDKREKNKIRRILLFGSIARGNSRKDSDVDLFIDVDDKDREKVDELVKEALNEFELKASKTWKLRGIDNAIVPIVGDLTANQWRELGNEIASYALVLYGKYEGESKKNEHLVLIEYDLSKTRQKEKVHFLRKLIGYSSKKGKKVYAHSGLLQRVHAKKIASALIAGIQVSPEITALLKEFKIPFTIQEIWK